MIRFRFGRGAGHSWKSSFGSLSANLRPSMRDMTLRQIANRLAKQNKLVDGEIMFDGIDFNFKQRSCDL